MAKLIDKIAIFLVCVLISTSWCLYYSSNFILSLILGILIAIPVLLSWGLARNFAKNRKTMTASDLHFYLSMMGQMGQTALFANTIAPTNIVGKDNSYIMIKKQNELALIFANYKFGKTLKDEVARCYRKAKELQVDEVILLGSTDRSVMATSKRLDIPFRYPSFFEVKRYLIKHNALPKVIEPHKETPNINIKDIPKVIANMLQQRHAKRYLFVGAMLGLTALITPLKLYYLTAATLLFAIGVACMFFGEK